MHIKSSKLMFLLKLKDGHLATFAFTRTNMHKYLQKMHIWVYFPGNFTDNLPKSDMLTASIGVHFVLQVQNRFLFFESI